MNWPFIAGIFGGILLTLGVIAAYVWYWESKDIQDQDYS